MMVISNRAWVLVSRPETNFNEDNVKLEELPVPHPRDGEILVKNIWLSFDPTQLGWMKHDSYMEKIRIGEVVRSIDVGEVIESNNPSFKVGDLVSGLFGWQEYSISDGLVSHVIPIPSIEPPWYSLSLFGITGMSAYFGVKDIGKVRKGETFVVSSAAGSVGSIAGQISKIIGARVIGIAGGAEKCRWVVQEAGFDYCIDYKSENVSQRLSELCPDGIDVYFDNVGGKILDDILLRIRKNARIVICGAISDYDSMNFYPLRNYMSLNVNHGRMEGFIVTDYLERFGEAFGELRKWLMEGKLKQKEEIYEGLELAPEIFKKLFTGKNFGKQILKISDYRQV
ncbi:MAG: NADP-dependent oxidoreductase [Thermoplasmata archaeon]